MSIAICATMLQDALNAHDLTTIITASTHSETNLNTVGINTYGYVK